MLFSLAQPAMINEATLIAMQQQMAQQAAFAQIPDAVKRVSPNQDSRYDPHTLVSVHPTFPSINTRRECSRDWCCV